MLSYENHEFFKYYTCGSKTNWRCKYFGKDFKCNCKATTNVTDAQSVYFVDCNKVPVITEVIESYGIINASQFEVEAQTSGDITTECSNTPISFVRGQRGKPKLVVDGYCYIKNKNYIKRNQSGGLEKTYWNCAHVKLKKCRARIITVGSNYNEMKITNIQHNHPPEYNTNPETLQ